MSKMITVASLQEANSLAETRKLHEIAPCIGTIFGHEPALSYLCVWLQRQAKKGVGTELQ